MRRELSYQFDLDIERVHLIINMKCDVQVWWKSGKRKIATKNSIKLQGTEKTFDIKEKLSIIAKIGIQNGILLQKKTELLIILFTSQNTSKLGGRVYLNLADFVNADNFTAMAVHKCERSLQNCPDDSSKIIFNLGCKYIEETVANIGADNPNDISFQANSFSTSIGAGSSFGRKTDMTFRPDMTGQGYLNRQSEHSPKERKKLDDKQREKIVQTPSWDRSSYREQQKDLPEPVQNHQISNPPLPTPHNQSQRPLQFSFNPMTSSDRQKLGLDNSQIIKDLKQIVEQKNQTIRTLQQQILKMRTQHEQKNQKSSVKSLSLLNELNSTTMKLQKSHQQNISLQKQIEQIKEENLKLDTQYKSLHNQNSQSNNQYMAKLQQRKKMIEELNSKLGESDQKLTHLKDELFRRQNQVITKDKDINLIINNKQLQIKDLSDKFRGVSTTLKELQANLQKIYGEKEQIEHKYNEQMSTLQNLQQRSRVLIEEITKKDEKYSSLQLQYKQRELIITEIQNQYKAFSGDKMMSIKQKDQEVNLLRQKFNMACKKISETTETEQSLKNTISQKNIRIKTLENVYAELEKTLQQKEDLILKAKQYITLKQIELLQKMEEIKKRDDFIQKCRNYMETKEKQYNDLIAETKNAQVQNKGNDNLKKQLMMKQEMLQNYINERFRNEKQIEDMHRVIDEIRNRIMQYEDQIDELHRKHESQDGTLKELVKKNLDFEIQLNIKDYEIQALRQTK